MLFVLQYIFFNFEKKNQEKFFLPFKSFEKAIQALAKSRKKQKNGQSFFFQSKKKLNMPFVIQKVALLPK